MGGGAGDEIVGFCHFQNRVFGIWKVYDMLKAEEEDTPQLRGLWSITRVIDIQTEFLRRGAMRHKRLLETAVTVHATAERDMVFAF